MNRISRSASLYLVTALLLGQLAFLKHEYDFSAHQSGDTCTTCLHATPLSHAMVAADMPALPAAGLHIEFHSHDLHISANTALVYRARAPPFIPSV